MQQTKFTPGPWSVDLIRPDKEKGQDFEPRCSIIAPNPDPNPHYSGSLRIADIPDPYTDEEVANARLIAAAPELLEALEEIVRIRDEESDGVEHIVVANIARAAIAKATGDAI